METRRAGKEQTPDQCIGSKDFAKSGIFIELEKYYKIIPREFEIIIPPLLKRKSHTSGNLSFISIIISKN